MRVAFEHDVDPRLHGVRPLRGQIWHNTHDDTLWSWGPQGWVTVRSVFEIRGLTELVGIYGADEVERMARLMHDIIDSDPEGLIGKKWAELHMALKLTGVHV